MSRRSTQVMLALVVILAALVVFAKLRYSGKAPVKLPAESCNADLWKHVYQPERLRVIEACTAVEGRVTSVRPASDGDLHIALDPKDKSILNLINLMHAHGELVVEIVCEHSAKDGDAKITCGAITSQITVPMVGDRVRITGTYVTDTENKWNEIHPVSRIEILR